MSSYQTVNEYVAIETEVVNSDTESNVEVSDTKVSPANNKNMFAEDNIQIED